VTAVDDSMHVVMLFDAVMMSHRDWQNTQKASLPANSLHASVTLSLALLIASSASDKVRRSRSRRRRLSSAANHRWHSAIRRRQAASSPAHRAERGGAIIVAVSLQRSLTRRCPKQLVKWLLVQVTSVSTILPQWVTKRSRLCFGSLPRQHSQPKIILWSWWKIYKNICRSSVCYQPFDETNSAFCPFWMLMNSAVTNCSNPHNWVCGLPMSRRWLHTDLTAGYHHFSPTRLCLASRKALPPFAQLVSPPPSRLTRHHS